MVRLSDMPEVEAAHLVAKECVPFAARPWVEGPPLPERRVALVTSAGLHRVGDPAFSTVDLSYRVIPGSISTSDLTMTHSSVHFDRTGFREDVNVVFPLDRLRELESEGAIGSVADFHYSFDGVDLAAISDAEFDTIYQAWLDHGVLRIRGQTLDDTQLERFSARFGTMRRTPASASCGSGSRRWRVRESRRGRCIRPSCVTRRPVARASTSVGGSGRT